MALARAGGEGGYCVGGRVGFVALCCVAVCCTWGWVGSAGPGQAGVRGDQGDPTLTPTGPNLAKMGPTFF